MSGLIEGIKVVDYSSNASSFKPRLWLNSGTELAKDLVPADNYDRDAFIPSESWREANITEQKIIYNTNYKANTGSCIDKSNHIGILPLPNLLTEAFEELGTPFASTMSDCSFLWQQPACQEAVKNMLDYVKTFSELNYDQALGIYGISTNPPGLRTVTYDQENKYYIGLHLDSWDNLPLENRYLSTNRICVNLGLEDRYFLFINLTLMDMLYLLDVENWNYVLSFEPEERQKALIEKFFQDSSTSASIVTNTIGKRFFQQYPEYPVIKVRVSPGEAYIAPTENMIHDGCTFRNRFPDVTLTIRGHIGFP